MISLEDELRSYRLFNGLSTHEIAMIASGARRIEFAPGEMLIREGQRADTMYVVRRGHVAVEVHHPGRGAIVIEVVGEGDIVGWSWIAEPHRWTFDARAVDDVSVVAIDGTGIWTNVLADPSFGVALLSKVSAELLIRFQATRMRMLDLYGARSDEQ